MKNKLAGIIKIAFKNNYMKSNLGTASIKEKNKCYFYITEKNVKNISKVHLERDFFEVNTDVKKNINSNLNFHGKNMVKNYDNNFIILHVYPEKIIKYMKTKKLIDIKKFNISENLDDESNIYDLGKDGIIIKTTEIDNAISIIKDLENEIKVNKK